MHAYYIEYKGTSYGIIKADSLDEAEYSAAILVRQHGVCPVHRGFLFVTEQ